MRIKIYLFLFTILVAGIQASQAQVMHISGKILNGATGEPLAGASVLVKGLNVSTITNGAGVFVIDIPSPGSVLVVSFVGMKSLEQIVHDAKVLNL